MRNYSDQDKTVVAEKYYESKEWKPFLLEGLKFDTKNNVTEIIGRLFDRRRTFFTKIIGLTDHFPFFIKESVSEIRLLTFRDDPSSQTFEFIVKNFVSDLTAPILDIGKPNNDGVLNVTKKLFKSPKKKLPTKIRKTPIMPKHLDKSIEQKPNSARIKLQGKLQDQLAKIKKVLNDE